MAEVVDAQGESGRAVLGRTLKFLREQAGKSLGQLSEDTGYDKSYLSRLEKGERLSKRAVMEDLDSYYGSGDLLVREWRDARREVCLDLDLVGARRQSRHRHLELERSGLEAVDVRLRPADHRLHLVDGQPVGPVR